MVGEVSNWKTRRQKFGILQCRRVYGVEGELGVKAASVGIRKHRAGSVGMVKNCVKGGAEGWEGIEYGIGWSI